MIDNNQIEVCGCMYLVGTRCVIPVLGLVNEGIPKGKIDISCDKKPNCYYKQLARAKQENIAFQTEYLNKLNDADCKICDLEDEIGFLKMRLEATEHQDAVALAEREQIIREKDAEIEKLKEALEKIAKHDTLPCVKDCNYKDGKCWDKISGYGKRCPVGIAKQALEKQ